MRNSNWRSYYWKISLKVEQLKEAIGGKCFHCHTRGSKENPLEFAHLTPTGINGKGRGSHNRRLDLLKHLSDYTYLCRRCHKDFDGRNKAGVQPISIKAKLEGDNHGS